ncbi:MAG: hypothetical protein AAGF53_00745 [Pseudomonadota bacterium]
MSKNRKQEQKPGLNEDTPLIASKARSDLHSELVSGHANILSEPLPESIKRLIERLKESDKTSRGDN